MASNIRAGALFDYRAPSLRELTSLLRSFERSVRFSLVRLIKQSQTCLCPLYIDDFHFIVNKNLFQKEIQLGKEIVIDVSSQLASPRVRHVTWR